VVPAGAWEVILDLKPYPAMKDSGLPGLGPIPAAWSIARNGRLFVERNETGFADLPILEVSLRSGVRVRRFDGDSRKQLMSDRDKYKRACAGDLAYNMMRMWQGAVGPAPVDGLVSPAYVVARPLPGVVARYFAYLFRTDSYMGEIDQYSHGIVKDRNRLYWEQFKQMPSACPPTEEQVAIVRFLGHADRQIRRYIRAKQKLIKLLEEQKQAIIHRAVTRGLDRQVRLRPSVKWLDDAPEHWNQLFLGRCLRRIDQGWSPVAAEGDISLEQWAVLTLSAVRRGVFNGTAIKPVPTTARIPEGIVISNGDLLLTRSNTRERVGDLCIVHDARERTVFSDLIYRLTTDPTIVNPRFLMYQLLSPFGRRQIERDARGSSGTMPKIAHRHIRSWRVVVPPLAEQDEIVDAIEHATRQISEAVKRTEVETELLREYRTRLIADVVTGKLDVREAAATLPDEADEPEPLDEASATDADEANDADLDAAPEDGEA
jgi:type I restriction enzyme S subunit